jgi:hypothetical protein
VLASQPSTAAHPLLKESIIHINRKKHGPLAKVQGVRNFHALRCALSPPNAGRHHAIEYLLSYLFHGFDQFVGGIPLFGHLNLVSVDISNRFRITEGHTLGITVTVVALYSHPVLDIKEGMTKRACDDTGPASDTQIFVDNHTVISFDLPVASLGGADLDAIGLFAVIAGHGEVDPHMLPFDHFDPGAARIAGSGMKHRAHQFT